MKRLETREWVFVMLIVVLIQFIIQASAWLYGGNSGALGYLSFAGTAVSIILAVLAIIYSFLQASAQEKSSSNISTQVTKLVDVVQNIELSKETLQLTLDHLEGVTRKLDISIENQTNIREEVSSLSNLFNSLNVAPSSSDIDNELYSKPLKKKFNGLSLILVFVYYSAKLKLPTSKVVSKLAIPVMEKTNTFNDKNKERLSEFVEGSFLTTYQLLISFGWVEKRQDGTLFLNYQFLLECEKFIESVLQDNSKTDPTIKTAIIECKAMLESSANPEA
ncbi:hypothetical protein RQV66_000477 [Vibrio alginolyticus]|nr:hypothetical protein [Vibrio alginolyticus]